MRKREPEGAPEERRRQFEDQRGISDSPELPLDPDEEPDEDETGPGEKEEEESDTAGGKE
jgi:hypothetical protein